MLKTDIFWTDINQANERLAQTIILYDGDPYYVREAFTHTDGKARVSMMSCGPKQEEVRKLLNSAKFNRFRDLPQIGWFNPSSGGAARFLERSTRRSRQHGLSDNNVSQFVIREGIVTTNENHRGVSRTMTDQGFVDCVRGNFPSLGKILANIAEESCLAYSRQYAVYRDGDGIRWLFRNKDRIGIFSGSDTLNLLKRHSFYREEIMADEAFTLTRIQEF